jgi:hypothetical protein
MEKNSTRGSKNHTSNTLSETESDGKILQRPYVPIWNDGIIYIYKQVCDEMFMYNNVERTGEKIIMISFTAHSPGITGLVNSKTT